MRITCEMPNQTGKAEIEVNGKTTLQDVKSILSKTLSVDYEYLEVLLPKTAKLHQIGNIHDKAGKRKLERTRFVDLGIRDGDIFSIFITNKPRALKQYNSHLKKHSAQVLDELLYDQLDNLQSNGELSRYIAGNDQSKRGRNIFKRAFASVEDKEKASQVRNRAKLINDNMNLAFYKLPESFLRVEMLYIRLSIFGNFVNGFIDSGSQVTVMPVKTAARCSLLELVDPRFERLATGLGSARIIGRCHHIPLEIKGRVFHFPIDVIDFEHRVDFLIGLDFLKKFRCEVDSEGGYIVIEDLRADFLEENELEATNLVY